MSGITEADKYKAQVYDAVLNAFFKLREFDAESLDRPKADLGWDIAEAMVAAAVSGVTYKSQSRDRRFDAASLTWGYQGQLDARQAWRPDIRSADGLAELDLRIDAVIEGLMRPLRALTVPDRRAIVCMSFVRMALAHVVDLIDQHPEESEQIRASTLAILGPLKAAIEGKS
jgi:hypothetical protein